MIVVSATRASTQVWLAKTRIKAPFDDGGDIRLAERQLRC